VSAAPLLSVTVTNYNYARFLSRNIESILGQTFRDFELIIIDNASTDESLALIAGYARRDERIRVVVHERNLGIFASLRETCDLARGRYRVHVDADDWVISPQAFQRQIDLLEAHPEMSFVYSSMTLFGSDDRRAFAAHPYPRDVVLPGELAIEAMLGFSITHSGMMFRLDSYRAAGGYPSGFLMCLDVMLAVRLAEQGHVGYVDDALYAFRVHGGNDHLAPRSRVIRDEILPMIDAAFDGPLGMRLRDASAVRRRVRQKALVHVPTQLIFSGRLRAGWRAYVASAKARPIDTVFQRRTLALIAQTVPPLRGLLAAFHERRLRPRELAQSRTTVET
jgi:glycosyltransferase involved in cell wall biosynthesis